MTDRVLSLVSYFTKQLTIVIPRKAASNVIICFYTEGNTQISKLKNYFTNVYSFINITTFFLPGINLIFRANIWVFGA